MADTTQQERTTEIRKRRLSSLIVTRSRSVHGEIPEDNIAEQATDDAKRGPAHADQGDTGDVDQPS